MTYGSVTEQKLPATVQRNVLTWCPLMDLIALCSAEGGNIWVYRLSGQRVWSANTKKKCKVIQMTWRYDGKLLGVIFEDGSLQVFNGSNGKVVTTDEERKFTAINWAQDTTSQNKKVDDLLPNNLFGLDLLKHLPKLPSLPSNFQAFSRVSLDDTAETTDMLITGTELGEMELNLYGVFSIGGVQISQKEHRIQDVLAVADLSHFLAIVSNNQCQSLVKIKAGFIRKFGLTYLPEVSLTPAKVYALVDYVHEALSIIRKEVGMVTTQTKRAFVGLHDDHEVVKVELYDTLLTGIPSKNVVSWLSAELGDRGLKKWTKTALDCYDAVKKVLFENLVPGCERLVVLLCKLRGLANWTERGEPLGLVPERFNDAITQTTSIIKQAHALLNKVSEERYYFKSFSAWLEVVYGEIPDAPPATGKPLHDDPSSVKTLDVAKFITTYLGKSDSLLETMAAIDPLRQSCNAAFDESKLAMHKQVSVESTVNVAPTDSHNVHQFYDQQMDYWYVLIYQQDAQEFQLIRFKVSEESGRNISEAVVVQTEGQILQMEFVDNEAIMMITKQSETQHTLLSMIYNMLPYNLLSLTDHNTPLYTTIEANVAKQPLVVEKSRSFASEFIPSAFTVNGRPNRRIGFLLANDDRRSLFFDLDDDDEDEEMS